ncbi:MAG: nucleotidyltransferase family protein, partial [Lachnospiraceae bacterium]|nr:nucleotidyltransferase family protein [Lachnospiraceae bacterium]
MTAKGTERSIRVGCVLMASGASVRFGEENKLLAELHRQPMVTHILSTLDNVRQSLLSETLHIVVVCEDPRVERLAQDAGFDTICCPHPLQSDTVRDGLQYLLSRHAGLDGCMFVAADQPFLTAESILRLLAQFAAEPSLPCRLAYRSPSTAPADLDAARVGDRITPGNPVIFPAAMFDALLSLTGDHGGGTL